MEDPEPANWKDTAKSFFLPDPGHERSYALGILMDLAFGVIWFCLVFLVLDEETRNKLWYMPLLGTSTLIFSYS